MILLRPHCGEQYPQTCHNALRKTAAIAIGTIVNLFSPVVSLYPISNSAQTHLRPPRCVKVTTRNYFCARPRPPRTLVHAHSLHSPTPAHSSPVAVTKGQRRDRLLVQKDPKEEEGISIKRAPHGRSYQPTSSLSFGRMDVRHKFLFRGLEASNGVCIALFYKRYE